MPTRRKARPDEGDALSTYRAKRAFDQTPEPGGLVPKPAPKQGGLLIVHAGGTASEGIPTIMFGAACPAPALTGVDYVTVADMQAEAEVLAHFALSQLTASM